MAKELSDKLINDWQMLMSGFKQIAEKVPTWDVSVSKDKSVIINQKWSIICHFINFEYIEVRLSFKDDEIMTLRHIGNKYKTTILIVLEFINHNKDLK